MCHTQTSVTGAQVGPSAVVGGSFIKTAMTSSQTVGMEGGAEGVINVGMLEGGLAGG